MPYPEDPCCGLDPACRRVAPKQPGPVPFFFLGLPEENYSGGKNPAIRLTAEAVMSIPVTLFSNGRERV
jgi:hypothetical protein